MNRISVANFQVLDRSQNYRMFNVRTIVKPLKYLSQYNSLFFWPTLHVHLWFIHVYRTFNCRCVQLISRPNVLRSRLRNSDSCCWNGIIKLLKSKRLPVACLRLLFRGTRPSRCKSVAQPRIPSPPVNLLLIGLLNGSPASVRIR